MQIAKCPSLPISLTQITQIVTDKNNIKDICYNQCESVSKNGANWIFSWIEAPVFVAK